MLAKYHLKHTTNFDAQQVWEYCVHSSKCKRQQHIRQAVLLSHRVEASGQLLQVLLKGCIAQPAPVCKACCNEATDDDKKTGKHRSPVTMFLARRRCWNPVKHRDDGAGIKGHEGCTSERTQRNGKLTLSGFVPLGGKSAKGRALCAKERATKVA